MKTIATKIYRQKTITKINAKVKLLGEKTTINTITFLNLRLLITIFLFIFILIFFPLGYIIAPIITILVYYLMEYFFLDYQAEKRGKKLEKEALFFFEIFVLTLESGRNLRQALMITTENINSEISAEFKKTLKEVKLGKSLNEALETMKKRIPSATINNTILNMVQSNTFGNSMIDSVYNQIEYLQNKQLLDVKAEISKLPTKVSAISVLFFVPIMLLIILAPVIIEFLLK